MNTNTGRSLGWIPISITEGGHALAWFAAMATSSVASSASWRKTPDGIPLEGPNPDCRAPPERRHRRGRISWRMELMELRIRSPAALSGR